VQLGPRLIDRDTGLHPSNRAHPHGLVRIEHRTIGRAHVLVHCHRHPEIGAEYRCPGESFFRDADNGVRTVVQAQRLADEIAIRPEAPRPELVAQHDDGMRVRRLVFLGQEEPTSRRTGADDLEIVAGHERGKRALGRLRIAEAHHLRPELIRRDPLEERVARSHRLEQRIAEVIEPLSARAAADVDERRGIGHPGPRPQQDGVGQAEDRRRAGDTAVTAKIGLRASSRRA
jgi:hypothetical protein